MTTEPTEEEIIIEEETTDDVALPPLGISVGETIKNKDGLV